MYSVNISPFRARLLYCWTHHYKVASLVSSNAADLIFLHDSWPAVEVYEAEKDINFPKIAPRIDLIIEILSKLNKSNLQ